ncbi:MAG: dioxygenase [Candidatus Marinimicrobia bacterium]|nr:dioxygenase [Candidatus Neomarinimicrobiota bacterium]
MQNQKLSPILYLPHGGGPLPLLADPGHTELISFLNSIRVNLGEPRAILVVSAHWEEAVPSIQSAERPEMLYDYYGFPPETYQITYPAPGHPELAEQIQAELWKAGIKSNLNPERGFDHGLFVPLKIIFPEARIPCFQISLIQGLDPAQHIALGRALYFLRSQNVLIVGSGMSFHNMQAFFKGGLTDNRPDVEFDQWLVKTCCSDLLSTAERDHELINWSQAPAARYCHPREEHLLPLHVCYGAAGSNAPPAELVFNGEVLGARVSALLWS